MNYIKNKPYCIEERAKKVFGTLKKDNSKGRVAKTYNSVMDYVREAVCG